MGAEPYWYVVPYKPDLEQVLEDLRQREFEAGRYNPVMPSIEFPITQQSPSPGAQHETIWLAMEDADADGTRSILDISEISDQPQPCAACPLSDDALQDLYGTEKPTREAVEANMNFLEDIDRGHAVYIILYDHGHPTEVLFAGYSFD
jgi:hypothetical protein